MPPTATLEIRLGGEFPGLRVTSTQINVLDLTTTADRLFRARSGGELGGSFSAAPCAEASAPTSATKQQTLAEHRSRPLSEVLRDINKRSDNPITRLTFLALADRVAPGERQWQLRPTPR